ncbi:MAG: hypothetical protein C0469_14295 [Cyanobacteria bacterium DS2.3.42]|nr:hypothetical protein [Cyanobacteria bacterium DS2.3.42]
METRRRKSIDVAAIIIIAAFILFGCFGRTVLTGKEISKLPILASEDYFFNNSLRFTIQRPRFDPSLYQFHIPFQLYAAKEMKRMHLPLWNPCFGCGFPTFAELQYCTFSPFRGIFQASNSYLYNLGIAVKCLIAALGTFALSRLFTFSTGASVFAAIAYGLSPFVLRELELPNEVQMFPLLAAAFLYLGNGKSFVKTALLGACTAIALASMHPEFFFLAILNSLVIMLAARPFAPAQHPAQVGKNILLAGVIGVCLGAPLLLPFLELASNGDSYKFHEFSIQKDPIQTLLSGLVTPVNKGGSAFLGVVSLLMAIFALLFGNRKNRWLAIWALALGSLCSLPGPLEQLSKIQLFSLIPPRYWLAPFLMSLSLLAAHGVDLSLEQMQNHRRRELILLTVSAALLAIIPFVLINGHIVLPGFDGTLPAPVIMPGEAVKGALALAAAMAVMAAAYFVKLPFKAISILPLLLLAANLLSVGDASRSALSPTFPFTYSSSAVLEEIRKSGERMTAAGHHFFYPNIALAYELRDFRHTGPLVPRWISAMSRQADISKLANKGSAVSKAIDTASVNYLISRWPLHSSADKLLPLKPFPGLAACPQRILAPLVLKQGSYCLSTKGELFTKLEWELDPVWSANMATELSIIDADGKVLSVGPRSGVGAAGKSHSWQQDSIQIPDFARQTKDVYLVLRIYSALTEGMLPLNKTPLPARFLGVELLHVPPGEKNLTDLSQARLKFIRQDSDQVLLYRNTMALPQAYLAGNILPAESLAAAVVAMLNPGFDAHTQTIIEAPAQTLQLPNSTAETKSAEVQRPNASTVMVTANADHDSFLILTDTFYNGWHAYLDGKEVPIYRANVSFRACRVPQGTHQIRFEFFPLTFYGGLCITAITLLVCAFFIFRSLQNLSRTRF